MHGAGSANGVAVHGAGRGGDVASGLRLGGGSAGRRSGGDAVHRAEGASGIASVGAGAGHVASGVRLASSRARRGVPRLVGRLGLSTRGLGACGGGRGRVGNGSVSASLVDSLSLSLGDSDSHNRNSRAVGSRCDDRRARVSLSWVALRGLVGLRRWHNWSVLRLARLALCGLGSGCLGGLRSWRGAVAVASRDDGGDGDGHVGWSEVGRVDNRVAVGRANRSGAWHKHGAGLCDDGGDVFSVRRGRGRRRSGRAVNISGVNPGRLSGRRADRSSRCGRDGSGAGDRSARSRSRGRVAWRACGHGSMGRARSRAWRRARCWRAHRRRGDWRRAGDRGADSRS